MKSPSCEQTVCALHPLINFALFGKRRRHMSGDSSSAPRSAPSVRIRRDVKINVLPDLEPAQ